MKNPVFLALLASAIVFIVTYYYYNHYCQSKSQSDNQSDDQSDDQSSSNSDSQSDNRSKRRHKKNKNGKKTKQSVEINEVMVLSSAITGLVIWFIASYYFVNGSTSSNDNNEIIENEIDSSTSHALRRNYLVNSDKSQIVNTNAHSRAYAQKGGSINRLSNDILDNAPNNVQDNIMNDKIKTKMTKVPSLASDNVTRSYNLIGSGVNIPKSDLKIPSVLIDYR